MTLSASLAVLQHCLRFAFAYSIDGATEWRCALPPTENQLQGRSALPAIGARSASTLARRALSAAGRRSM